MGRVRDRVVRRRAAGRGVLSLFPNAPYQVDFAEKPYRTYKIDGLKVPSVTKILGILDKPALRYWAQKEAVRGVCELALQYGADDAVFRDAVALERAMEGMPVDPATFVDLYARQNCTLPFERPQDVLRLVKSGEVDIQSRMKQAAARGTAVHGGWEEYAATGKFPQPPEDHPEWHGFFVALAKATLELRPKFHGSEVVVGSKRHRYGGRLDHLLSIRDETRRGLIDLKSNKAGRVYALEHGLQVAGYSGAAVEMGMPEPDFLAVLAIGEEGNWEFVETKATPEQFQSLVPVQAMLDKIEREAKKAAK